ncbi:autotransporter adhesin BpaC-like isoform X2 [Dermacentor albipictus]|uniref:autotransporter adhesin BpaC-like isoform X2 n=1 Tax=Dermacentor albipictus TaxID=60249 RepID=UPI0038FC33F5
MTSAVLVVCTLLFLASRSDAADGDAGKGNTQCNDNDGLLADSNCMVICNGSVSANNRKAADGTKCRISGEDNRVTKTEPHTGTSYGTCRNNNCTQLGANGTSNSSNKTGPKVNAPASAGNASSVTPGSSNPTKQNGLISNSTTTSSKNESTAAATKVTGTATSAGNATATPSTTAAPNSAGGAPGATPAANGSSRLVSAAGSDVLAVALAVGALLWRAA